MRNTTKSTVKTITHEDIKPKCDGCRFRNYFNGDKKAPYCSRSYCIATIIRRFLKGKIELIGICKDLPMIKEMERYGLIVEYEDTEYTLKKITRITIEGDIID